MNRLLLTALLVACLSASSNSSLFGGIKDSVEQASNRLAETAGKVVDGVSNAWAEAKKHAQNLAKEANKNIDEAKQKCEQFRGQTEGEVKEMRSKINEATVALNKNVDSLPIPAEQKAKLKKEIANRQTELDATIESMKGATEDKIAEARQKLSGNLDKLAEQSSELEKKVQEMKPPTDLPQSVVNNLPSSSKGAVNLAAGLVFLGASSLVAVIV